jgi:hypothetical protein
MGPLLPSFPPAIPGEAETRRDIRHRRPVRGASAARGGRRAGRSSRTQLLRDTFAFMSRVNLANFAPSRKGCAPAARPTFPLCSASLATDISRY